MAEYPVYIDALIEADNDEDAEAITLRLAERVFEHPAVGDVEARIEKSASPPRAATGQETSE